MKRVLSISIPLAALLVALFFIFINAQQGEHKIKHEKYEHSTKLDDKAKKKSCCSEETESGKFSENSIYQVESKWKTQSGKQFDLAELKGSKVVLSMIFANCTYACPVIVNDMKRVENKLSTKEKKDTKFILVSIDPERDTPEALTLFAKRYNLDLKQWTLLTGNKEDIRELAALFGFRYVKDDQGNYSHSNLINVLDKNGEIAYQHEGLNKDIDDIINKLESLTNNDFSMNEER